MKKRHSTEQIIRILKEVEQSGLKVSDACRPQQISEQTYYRWRQKYGGMEVNEAQRLKGLEELLVCTGRKTCFIRSDNGSEFVARSIRKWLKKPPLVLVTSNPMAERAGGELSRHEHACNGCAFGLGGGRRLRWIGV